MRSLEQLISSAEALASALDDASGSEHHRSKEIRRFFSKHKMSHRETILKLKSMIDHDEGLLNSIDNELIQLCYPVESEEHETERVKEFIALLTSRTEFVKHLFLIQNSPLIGFD